MKKRTIRLVASITLAALALSIVGLGITLARAATLEVSDAVFVNDEVKDDLYLVGGNVIVDENINGDVIVAGGQIEISGNVTGDVLVFGGQVSINGDVNDDVRVLGGSATINGSVGDDIVALSGSTNISSKTDVYGDIYIVAANTIYNGSTRGDITILSASVVFGGEVQGDANITTEENLILGKSARIHGDLNYRASQELDSVDGVVLGNINFQEIAALNFDKAKAEVEEVREEASGVISATVVFLKIWSYLSMLFIGLVILLASKYAFRESFECVKKDYWKSLLYGFLFIIVLPVTAVLLIITIIGFKLAILLLMAMALYWSVAKIFAGYYIGAFIFQKKTKTGVLKKDIIRLASGLAILVVLTSLPYFGFMFSMIFTFTGIGAVLLYKAKVFKSLRTKKLI